VLQLKSFTKCSNCNQIINNRKNAKFCSSNCRQRFNDKTYWKSKIEKSHIQFSNTDELNNSYVECAICTYRTKDLAQHPSIHGLSQIEYKTNYGRIKCEQKIESIKGKNNPWANHNGIYSPFSTKYIKYDDSNSQEKIKEIKKKAKQTQIHNHNNPLSKEYFIKRGFDEDVASTLLKQRQSTFTLEKCITKYGEEKGLVVWTNRQLKWQKTLDSKSEKQKQDINSRKSTKINYKTLWSCSLNEDGYFYVLKINDNAFKIGITSKPSITQRYKLHQLKNVQIMLFTQMSNINHAFQTEQLLKRKYKQHINKENSSKWFGWSETFKEINYDKLSIDIDKYSNDSILTENEFNAVFKPNSKS